MNWQQRHKKLMARKAELRIELEVLRQQGHQLEQEYVAVKVELEVARTHLEAEAVKEVT